MIAKIFIGVMDQIPCQSGRFTPNDQFVVGVVAAPVRIEASVNQAQLPVGLPGVLQQLSQVKRSAVQAKPLDIVFRNLFHDGRGKGPGFRLQVTKQGTGNGTVTSSPSGISCGTDCSEDYVEGTAVNLTAAANTYSNFTGSLIEYSKLI